MDHAPQYVCLTPGCNPDRFFMTEFVSSATEVCFLTTDLKRKEPTSRRQLGQVQTEMSGPAACATCRSVLDRLDFCADCGTLDLVMFVRGKFYCVICVEEHIQ